MAQTITADETMSGFNETNSSITNTTPPTLVVKEDQHFYLPACYIVIAISILTDCCLCLSLMKSNQIEKNVRNSIILHWRFLDILHLMILAFSLAEDQASLRDKCTFTEMEGSLSLCVAFLAALVLVEAAFLKNSSKSTTTLICLSYVGALITFLIFMKFCQEGVNHEVFKNILYGHVLVLVLVIICELVLCCSKFEMGNERFMTTLLVYAALLVIFPERLLIFMWGLDNVAVVILETLSPLLQLMVLVVLDRNFRAAFKQVLKCQYKRPQYSLAAYYESNNGKL